MASSQLQNQLRDIHLPQSISWWPMAPGWYLLAFLILIVALIIGFWLKQKYHQTGPKREALKLLSQYEKEYAIDKNSQETSRKISQLLRRVALQYFPKEQVASLIEDDWINFLKATSQNASFETIADLLTELPYQSPSAVDLTPLFLSTKTWIKERGNLCTS